MHVFTTKCFVICTYKTETETENLKLLCIYDYFLLFSIKEQNNNKDSHNIQRMGCRKAKIVSYGDRDKKNEMEPINAGSKIEKFHLKKKRSTRKTAAAP